MCQEVGNFEQVDKDRGCFILAEGVSKFQFDIFQSENKGKNFRLRDGKLLYELKQRHIHSQISQYIIKQFVDHFGGNVACFGDDLADNNYEYPDVEVCIMERLHAGNRIPNIICEIAYSNQTLTELHEMVDIYLDATTDIEAFLGIKVSYPSNPYDTFQMVVMLYLQGPTYYVPVEVWSCGSVPLTEGVIELIGELTGLSGDQIRGNGFDTMQPPNEENDLNYRIPIPDGVFLKLHQHDDLSRFVDQTFPIPGFELHLQPIYNAVCVALQFMQLEDKPAGRNLSLDASIDHLVDHLL